MPTPRRLAGHAGTLQVRARYVRAGANDLMVNSPDGYPSDFAPITWIDGGGNGPTDWWWGSDSGGLRTPIGPHGPFTHGHGQAVVTRATSLIVGPLSAAPYRVVSETTVGSPLPTPLWIRDPMKLRPDARGIDAIYPSVLRLPRSEFWGGLVRNALHFGLGSFLYIPDEAGAPLAGTLRLVDPRFLATERDNGGSLHWSIDGGEGNPAVFDREGRLTLGEITYQLAVLRNPLSPIDSEGMSAGVFAMSPAAFRIGHQISQYMAGTFRSGVPAGYLKVETPGLTQAQSDELKGKWMANHGGDRRSIAVLNATTSFVPLNFSPVDAAIGESFRLAIADVAYAFGLDPVTLNVSLANSATYTNIRDAWVNHRDFGLSPWIAALQDVLSALVPGSAGVIVNLDGFANPPLAERVTTGASAVEAGLMTIDEWRASEGLPPMPQRPPELKAPPDPADRHLRLQPWRG